MGGIFGKASGVGAAKFWCVFDGTAAGPIAPDASFNVVDITDNGTGDYTVNIDTDFASADWAPLALCRSADALTSIEIESIAAGSVKLQVMGQSSQFTNARDSSTVSVAGFGEQ